MLLGLVSLVEMLPYLGSPNGGCVFYFIVGGIEYVHFKKMNRKD